MCFRVAAVFTMAVLLIGCGLGRSIVRNVSSSPVQNGQHPLSDKVFGLKSVARSIRCLKAEEEPESTNLRGGDCSPVVDDPHYSLSLSGGGFRATLFHYGAVKRLNDIGRLRDARMICGISGGAIVAALLVSRWHQLEYDENGVAKNLYEVVGKPIDELSSINVDKKIAWRNALPFRSAGTSAEPVFDAYMFNGALLRDLPNNENTPLLVLGTTNYETGEAWVISRDYFGGSLVRSIDNRLTIAQGVAASAAFPPVLGPISFEFEGSPFPVADLSKLQRSDAKQSVKQVAEALVRSAEEEIEQIGNQVLLVDGGVLDNNAIKHCAMAKTQYVSNASRVGKYASDASSWMSVVSRVVDLIHGELGDVRFTRKCLQDQVVCWELRKGFSAGADFGLGDDILSDLEIAVDQPTRFKAMNWETKCVLSVAGYLSASQALATKGKQEGANSPEMLLCDFDKEQRALQGQHSRETGSGSLIE